MPLTTHPVTGERTKTFTDYGHQSSLSQGRRYEKVATTDGGDGKWHVVHRQSKRSSCGPTCVRMVIERVTGSSVGEEYVRGLTTLGEADIAPSDQGALDAATEQAHDWNGGGVRTGPLLQALKNAKATSAAMVQRLSENDLKQLMLSSTLTRPAIIKVSWTGGGSHFVVVAGRVGDGSTVRILDPAYGLQHLDTDSPRDYVPRRAGKSTGQQLATGRVYRGSAITTV